MVGLTESSIRVRAEIGSPRRVRSHRFKFRLAKASKRRTIRAFELKLIKERDQSISKFFVRRDRVSDVCSVNLLGFLGSQPGENKRTQGSRKRLQSVRNNSASAKNARILIPYVFVKSCLDADFNNVTRSVASQAIPATAFGFD